MKNIQSKLMAQELKRICEDSYCPRKYDLVDRRTYNVMNHPESWREKNDVTRQKAHINSTWQAPSDWVPMTQFPMVSPMAEPSITIGHNNNWNNGYNTGAQAYRTSNNKVNEENPNNYNGWSERSKGAKS